MDIYSDREREEDYPGVSSDTIINAIPNAEKVSVETVDKLLKYKNAVMCFMSCGNIYIILEKYENLLKEQEKVTNQKEESFFFVENTNEKDNTKNNNYIMDDTNIYVLKSESR